MWSISNSLEFYFSQSRPVDSISDSRFLFNSHNIHPQLALPKDSFFTDTTQFSLFSGVFQAAGGEQYLTLGDFQPSDSAKFLYLLDGQVYRPFDAPNIFFHWGFLMDDFSLTLIPPPDSMLVTTADTTHCFGTDLTLTASAQGAQWYQWNTGQTDSSITITQPGTYWVEAGFNCGYSLWDTIRVSAVPDNPITPLPQDTVICPNDPVTLRVPWSDALSQVWSTGSTEESITVNQAGIYHVTAQVPCGHQRTATIHISYDADLPPHPLPLDTTICEGDAFRFTLFDGVQYQLNGQPVAPPALEIREPGVYVLSMFNRCFQDEVTLYIEQEPCQTKHWVPNAFTPNGDGLNDCFGPVITNFNRDSFEFYISDRWGNVIYQSTDYDACWDGRVNGQLKLGTYTWRLVYRGRFNGYQEHFGYVQVLR
jgi:gliding motility-associated-like protein